MSNARDQIFAVTDDLNSENVTVPEWGGIELVVRELNMHDRNVYLQSGMERVEVAGGFEFIPVQDPMREARLVILTTFDADGVRVFEDDDLERLGARSSSAVDRLATVATRLSGIGPKAADEAGKDSEPTPSSTSPSS